MTTPLLKYALSFCLGIAITYGLMSSQKTNEQISFNKSLQQCPSPDNQNLPNLALNSDLDNRPATPNTTVCEEEIKQLEQKVVEAKFREDAIVKEMTSQLVEKSKTIALMTHKINTIPPQNVNKNTLKKLIPEAFFDTVSAFPDTYTNEIIEFHETVEDLDWGYNKQQQLTDFIRTHLNYPEINLISVICKIDTCEVMITEKRNTEALVSSGASQDEIQSFIDTQEPKYKPIFDQINTNPELNVSPTTYSPGRFQLYAIFKDKSASITSI